jgi:competence protein ComEA
MQLNTQLTRVVEARISSIAHPAGLPKDARMTAWAGRNPFVLFVVAGTLLIGGLVVRDFLRPSEAPVLVLQEDALAPGTPIKVHVAGAVASPGVYDLVSGDRVDDALAAAGGAVEGADLESINLARHLRDGEQILIEGPAASSEREGAPGTESTGSSGAEVGLTPGVPLDLNTATREQLDALPGIGEAYSLRIVNSRLVDGPFASVDDMLARNLLPARTLEGIRAMVTVSTP